MLKDPMAGLAALTNQVISQMEELGLTGNLEADLYLERSLDTSMD